MLPEHYTPTGAPRAEGRPVRPRLGRTPCLLWRAPDALPEDSRLGQRLGRRAALRHPALARLLDYGLAQDDHPELGLEAGDTFLVFADPGEGLAGSPLPAARLLAITAQLLSALRHAHEQGCLLGDLSSEQLTIAPGGPVLLGLGPVRGQGAPGSAPERRRGEDGTVRSDLYALGALLVALSDEDAANGSEGSALRTVLARLTHPRPQARSPDAATALRELLEWHPGAGASLEGALPEPPLVGRDELLESALDALQGRLFERRPESPSWLLLRGEPGSGRTRLLDELASRLRRQGAACFDWSRDSSIADALQLAQREPVLVTLRDLDHASPDLQRAVLDLVRRAAATPVPLAVACTLSSARGELAKDLEAAAAYGPPLSLELTPLADSDLASLVGQTLQLDEPPPALVTALRRWGGGNPGLARLGLQRLLEAGVIEPDGVGHGVRLDLLDGVPGGPPPSTAMLPSGVTRDERRVLRTLCVAPAPLPEDELLSRTGLAAPSLHAACQRLLAAGVLAAGDAGLRFRRSLLQDQTRAALPKRERERLHRDALARLRARAGLTPPEDLSDDLLEGLAHHALAVGDGKAAARYVPEAAARSRRQGEPRRGATLLSGLLEHKLPAARRVELLGALGQALLAAGRASEAEDAFARALATRSPKVTALERVALHRQRAMAALSAGASTAAREGLERARELLEREDERDDAWEAEDQALVKLAVQEAHGAGRHRQVLRLTGRLLQRLERDPDATLGLCASLYNTRGLARFYLGDLPRAQRLLRKSLHLCRQLDHTAGVVATLGNLACVYGGQGAAARAARLHRASGRRARASSLPVWEAKAHSNLGNLESARGRLRRARRRFRQALRIDTQRGDDRAASIVLCSLGDTYLGESDPVRAEPYFERAAALASAIGFPYGLALARINQAHTAMLRGTLEEARARAAESVELRRQLAEPSRLARALSLAARIELTLGRDDLGAPLLAEAQTALGEDPNPVARGELFLARGALSLRRDALEDAEAHGREALRSMRAGHYRWGCAEARLLLTRVHLREGRIERAQSEARGAAAEAEACGARGIAAAAEVVLADAILASEPPPERLLERLDRLRAARTVALERTLPELARAAAGALARALACLGRADESQAEVLAARKAVEHVTSSLSRRDARSLRERPDVQRDTSPPAPSKAAAPDPSPPQPTSPPTALEDQLAKALHLFEASAAYALRREGATFSTRAARAMGSTDPPTPSGELLTAAQRAPSPCALGAEHGLVVPIGSRRGVLALVRGVPFSPQELELATGYAAGLSLHMKSSVSAKAALAPWKRWGLVGRSPAMAQVHELVERFARFDLPVLIQGETGTGKELVARAVHAASTRREGPFVVLDCAGLSESLVTVELFGATAGAYTGAEARPGLFELADGGTLFLDGVSELTPSVQAMLLRVLEEGALRRVGGDAQAPVDVRVISATHTDLREACARGALREDLYYRLSVLCLDLPPLRSRGADSKLLAKQFLKAAQREGRSRATGFSPAALRAIAKHDWPGNVRQLKNAIERAIALARDGTLSPQDLGLKASPTAARARSGSPEERAAIEAALGSHKTLTAAARSLGMDRRTLRRRMDRYGLQRP